LLGPHSYDTLTAQERAALTYRFGLNGIDACSMKELAPRLGCTRAEACVVLGSAIDKVRTQLLRD
jgi:DNA-directed RNA polymerase sigma subunit (sigma70/sigma32)